MSSINALDSHSLVHHELLKLSRLVNAMTVLLLQETGVLAVFRAPVQYSKIPDSSHYSPFDEMRSNDICKDLVYCGILQGTVEAT